MEKSGPISTQKLASSTFTFEELTTFHLHLPLDSKIHQLLSEPDDLMQYLYEMDLETSAEPINIRNAILKNQDYDTFLSFVLFRLNYIYFHHKKYQDDIKMFISRTLPLLLTQKVKSNAEGLSVRLAIVLNASQSLLESDDALISEALQTFVGPSSWRIYSPLNENSTRIAKILQEKLKKITQTPLFIKTVEEYLNFFKSGAKLTDMIDACRALKIVPFGVRAITRVLGLILPDGIALNLKYLPSQASEELMISRSLIVLLHNVGQYIARLLNLKTMTIPTDATQFRPELFHYNKRGYLFQAILFGDILSWNDPIFIKKLLNVHDWQTSPPLFKAEEVVNVEKQKIWSTLNSSMLLKTPMEPYEL